MSTQICLGGRGEWGIKWFSYLAVERRSASGKGKDVDHFRVGKKDGILPPELSDAQDLERCKPADSDGAAGNEVQLRHQP